MMEPSIYKETKELPVPEGEEGMMVGVSLIQEEPHHHGGLCSPVPNHATIPVNGVECGGVLGVQCTGDPWAGARTPLPRGKPTNTRLDCRPEARLDNDSGVAITTPSLGPKRSMDDTFWAEIIRDGQAVKETADSGKVSIKLCSDQSLKSPSIVNGSKEYFQDVKSMVGVWEGMEKEEEELPQGERKGGGGRRRSERISDMLCKFQGEVRGESLSCRVDEMGNTDSVQNLQLFSCLGVGVVCDKNVLKSKISAIKKKFKTDVVTRRDLDVEISLKSAGCDWPEASVNSQASTNEKAGKRRGGMIDGNCSGTKKRRTGFNN